MTPRTENAALKKQLAELTDKNAALAKDAEKAKAEDSNGNVSVALVDYGVFMCFFIGAQVVIAAALSDGYQVAAGRAHQDSKLRGRFRWILG